MRKKTEQLTVGRAAHFNLLNVEERVRRHGDSFVAHSAVRVANVVVHTHKREIVSESRSPVTSAPFDLPQHSYTDN